MKNHPTCLMCFDRRGDSKKKVRLVQVYLEKRTYRVPLCASCERELFLTGQKQFEELFTEYLAAEIKEASAKPIDEAELVLDASVIPTHLTTPKKK